MPQHITWETKLLPWNKGQKQEKLIKYGMDNVHEHLWMLENVWWNIKVRSNGGNRERFKKWLLLSADNFVFVSLCKVSLSLI